MVSVSYTLAFNNSNNYLIGVKFQEQKRKRNVNFPPALFRNGGLQAPKESFTEQRQGVGTQPNNHLVGANRERQGLGSSSRMLWGL